MYRYPRCRECCFPGLGKAASNHAQTTLGLQFHTSDSISVAIRFYPDPVIEKRARWSDLSTGLMWSHKTQDNPFLQEV